MSSRPRALAPADPGSAALWTAEETAAYLVVPIATLYAWRYVRTGPPAHRIGRYLRYDPAEVRRWVAAQ